MRRLVAFFMILSSLMAVGQTPRAEAAVVLASNTCAPEGQAGHSDQVRVTGREPARPSSAGRSLVFAAAQHDAGSVATVLLGSDRARE